MPRHRHLQVEKASVSTVRIEMKALMIDDKQVTLSVFRQLEHEPLIDTKTGEFKGLPWGHVNYFWKGCDQYWATLESMRADDVDRGLVRHVVWQDGSELRRALVFHPRRGEGGSLGLGVAPLDLDNCAWDAYLSDLWDTDGDYTRKAYHAAVKQGTWVNEKQKLEWQQEPAVLAAFEREKQWQEILDLPQLFIAV